MINMDQLFPEFEKQYVHVHGFFHFRDMVGAFIADFVENDPRAFTGFSIEDLTYEFMAKYHIPTNDSMLVDDIMYAVDDESFNY